MLAAVDSCSRAYRSWSETSILARQQVFLRYQQLIKDNIVSQRVGKCKVQLKQELIVSTFKFDLLIYQLEQQLLLISPVSMLYLSLVEIILHLNL